MKAKQEQIQVLEITPAPTWHYDSIIIDVSKSWGDALEYVERALDRHLEEVEEDPELEWEGRKVTIEFKTMSQEELDTLMEESNG